MKLLIAIENNHKKAAKFMRDIKAPAIVKGKLYEIPADHLQQIEYHLWRMDVGFHITNWYMQLIDAISPVLRELHDDFDDPYMLFDGSAPVTRANAAEVIADAVGAWIGKLKKAKRKVERLK